MLIEIIFIQTAIKLEYNGIYMESLFTCIEKKVTVLVGYRQSVWPSFSICSSCPYLPHLSCLIQK